MSGRGRGRGRGRGAPLSQSKLLLKRSAQEAGLDEQRAILELSRPSNFSDYLWHSSGKARNDQEEGGDKINNNGKNDDGTTTKLQITKRSTITRNLVIKQRSFMEHFAASPFYLRVNQNVDVARYSIDLEKKKNGKTKPTEPDAIVLEEIGEKLANDERFVPEELGPNRLAAAKRARKRGRNAGGKDSTDLDVLERREKKTRGDGDDDDDDNKEGEEEDEDELEGLNADDGAEEDGDDYIQDYYASEDEDDGGGDDGEPVF